ncbi:putative lysocardiolipin acyltransferase 1-like protein [Tupanvirus deep ocean]|uniref:Lysocardiolipin acyltransferase 1-like protein n=2 Tax=Tupanvirus TaxID=2094720 RepID=A0AC62A7I6_9VIRU|nr:putative lysocardiolipin acyltransferase 1-like protein [Tupanvirus deep ocean]QKU33684.1 putative lysocardiolipin acyltransferase 1-like protein [Tupanvirus deep ocean]
MTFITVILAFIYYVYLIMLTYMYNIISEFTNYAETIYRIKSGVSKKTMREVGLYDNIKYYYAHGFLLILKIFGIKVYLNNEISSKRMLWISNHRSKMDGLIIQSILCANGNHVVSVVKKTISYIPIFGSFGVHSYSIFIQRVREVAEKVLSYHSRLCYKTGRSVLVFPEGTTMTPSSKKRSDKFALENNIQVTKNVLVPRTTGFKIIKTEGCFDTVGNITIRYADPDIPNPSEHSFADLFKIFPKKIYLDVSYENIDAEDLQNVFNRKDKLLDQPLVHDIFNVQYKYSKMCLIFNLFMFILFYFLIFMIPYFGYATLVITLIGTIATFFK